jgi:hypothetical protein
VGNLRIRMCNVCNLRKGLGRYSDTCRPTYLLRAP